MNAGASPKKNDDNKSELRVEQRAAPGVKTFVRIVDWISNEKFELINVTDRINEVVSKSGVKNGVVHLQSLHTTAAVFINEWQDALLHDIRTLLEQAVGRDGGWRHDDPGVFRLRAQERRVAPARPLLRTVPCRCKSGMPKFCSALGRASSWRSSMVPAAARCRCK